MITNMETNWKAWGGLSGLERQCIMTHWDRVTIYLHDEWVKPWSNTPDEWNFKNLQIFRLGPEKEKPSPALEKALEYLEAAQELIRKAIEEEEGEEGV